MADDGEVIPSLPDLAPGELQVWRIDLADAEDSPEIYRYRHYLSREELERSDRLRAALVRQQFLVARTCLRILLGNALNLDPKKVSITLNPYGKPETPPVAGSQLHFNLAHSRETILIALCRECPIGIDLEYLDRETEVLEVARNFFHPDEFHQIAGIADLNHRRRAFFQCWTRKEAVIKADGRGLSLPLTAFQVPVLGSAAATPVTISEEKEFVSPSYPRTAIAPQSFVTDLALGGNVAAAFAAGASTLRPRTIAFPFAAL